MVEPLLVIYPSWIRRITLTIVFIGGIVALATALYMNAEPPIVVLSLGIAGISLLPLVESFTDYLIVTKQKLFLRKSFWKFSIEKGDIADIEWSPGMEDLILRSTSGRCVVVPSWHQDIRAVEIFLRKWIRAT